jgi:hypothetical protein
MKKVLILLWTAAVLFCAAEGSLWAKDNKKTSKKKAREEAGEAEKQKAPKAPSDFEFRAVPSLTGESGLFEVYTADTFCARQLAVQLSFQNWDRDPGAVSEDEYALSFGYGLTDRLEASVSLRAIELSIRHDPSDDPAYYMGSPVVGRWHETGLGNPHFGVKYNFLREREGGRPGFAVQGYLELPRRDQDAFRGTGKTVYGATLIATKRFGKLGTSLNFGYRVYDPERNITGRYEINDQWTYGLGLRFPEGRRWNVIGEISGYFLAEDEKVSSDMAALFPMYTEGDDLPDHGRTYFNVGGQYQFRSGITVGAAARYTHMQDSDSDQNDGWGVIAKISYSTACRKPAPAPRPKKEEPAGEVLAEREMAREQRSVDVELRNLAPTVKLQPDAMVVQAGESIRIRALGEDPEGKALAYGWKPEGGSVAGSGDSVMWKAPDDCDKPVIIKTRATDPEGAYGEDSVIIQVICPDEEEAPMERVFFEFDRYDLTAKGAASVQRMAQHLKKNPKARVTVEGHTCNIGTDAYNMALGQHRAESVRNELVRQGVSPTRIKVISYGLNRPAYSNDAEESRQFNRRADFVLEKNGK